MSEPISSRSLGGKPCSYLLDDRACRRHHSEDNQAAAIDDDLAIDENFILSVASRNRLHLDPKLATKPRRRTDGVYSRDSERAIAHRDPDHG